MTNLRKIVTATLAVAVLAGSGVSVSTGANAAPMIRTTAVETQSADVIKVSHHHHHRRHHWGHYGGYFGGYCFFKKRRFWDDYYGWYYKRIRICY
jgi:hypothetical protein